MSRVRERGIPECDTGTAVIVCGCGNDADAGLFPRGCAAFLFSCGLEPAQNEFLRAVSFESDCINRLQMLIAGGGNAHQFILELSDIVGGDAILLDESFRVIFTSDMRLNGLLRSSVSSTGEISADMVNRLVNSPDRYKGNVGVSTFREFKTSVFSTRSVSPEGLSVTLLLEKSSDLGDDIFGLMNNIHKILKNWLFSGGYAAATKIYTSFQKCWDRMISGESANNAELLETFASLPHPIKGDIRVGAIIFRTPKNIPFNYILARLRNIDSDINVAIDNTDLVLVLTEREVPGRKKSAALEKLAPMTDLLRDFDAYLMYGNHTSRPRHIADVFNLTRKVLIIASKLEPDTRIFYYEDYASYGAIDLAAQSYLKSDISADAYLLVNPHVMALAIHDKTCGDDLRDVLFNFLVCERNVKKTAEAMHMHRNTVLNKLKKIESIADIDYEDYQLRQRLLFSCQFIRYYEKVLEMPLPAKSGQEG